MENFKDILREIEGGVPRGQLVVLVAPSKGVGRSVLHTPSDTKTKKEESK